MRHQICMPSLTGSYEGPPSEESPGGLGMGDGPSNEGPSEGPSEDIIGSTK